jgi:hypothetical protein
MQWPTQTFAATAVVFFLGRVHHRRLGGARYTTWRDDASTRTRQPVREAIEELRTLSDNL